VTVYRVFTNHSFLNVTFLAMQKEYEYEDKAMGTDVAISITSNDKELSDTLGAQMLHTIHEYEHRFSRFRAESELSVLNRVKEKIVSDTFLETVQEAYRLFVVTRGIFNPLVQIRKLGYTRSFNDPNFGKDIEEDTEPYDIDFSATIIDLQHKKIILNDGQMLDFGGFLKGYLATLLCNSLATFYPRITGAIVNIGGDIHTYGLDPHDELFTFTIFNPIQNTEIIVPAHNTSIATSGSYNRTWKQGDRNIHHILDATGIQNPKTDIVSATVLHKDGSTAEAYAKVFLSIGPTEALKLLPERKISFVVIDAKGKVTKNI
jgi:thiamine biosynthesis lipoprotein